MSADNGIYILRTRDPSGDHEFRVMHAQNIEDLEYWPLDQDMDNDSPSNWERREEVCPDVARNWFVDAEVFTNEDEAYEYARQLYDEYPIVEYGICPIDVEFPFEVPF